MGGLDKHLNSAIRRGIITKIKYKKPKIKNKNNDTIRIIIDTDYFLKTGIKRELKGPISKNPILEEKKTDEEKEKIRKEKRREYHREWRKKNRNTGKYDTLKKMTKEERRLRKNKLEMNRYYNNREKRLKQLKERYANNTNLFREKRRLWYIKNKEAIGLRAKERYKREKIKKYFNNNILVNIKNASFKA